MRLIDCVGTGKGIPLLGCTHIGMLLNKSSCLIGWITILKACQIINHIRRQEKEALPTKESAW